MAGASGIAAVGEPAGGVGGRDGLEGLPGGGAEVVVGPSPSAPESVLDLGEGFLDRIEVGRVGREREETRATLLDGGADGRVVVGLEVVEDDDLAPAEGRGEAEADIALEAVGRHGAVKPQERPNA